MEGGPTFDSLARVNTDNVDEGTIRDRIVSLSSNAAHENSQIEAIQHEDEHEAVLTKIQEIVGNDAYQVEEDDELRLPEYGDIAVLTRTRDFGRELLSAAEEYGLPMAYKGGIELFRSDPAKLLLAWLRILESDAERGWAVVLEEAGYTLDEVKHVLDTDTPPIYRHSNGSLEHWRRSVGLPNACSPSTTTTGSTLTCC